MMRTLKKCCFYGAIIFCGLLITNATINHFYKPTPIKIYVTPKFEQKKYRKRNTKLYEHLKTKPVDQQQQFYNTIIENNIFAPLGYKPQKKAPIYRLIGTHIPIHKENEATAILQETIDKKRIHIVNIGTILEEDTVVTDIQSKLIILKKGTRRILVRMTTMQFLN